MFEVLNNSYSYRASSSDIFARLNTDGVPKLINTISSIVKTLNGALAKRKSKPVAGPEVIQRYNQEAAKQKDTSMSKCNTY